MKTNLFTITTLSLLSVAGQAMAKPLADLRPDTHLFKNGTIIVHNLGDQRSRASWLTIKCHQNCPEHPAMAKYKKAKFPNTLAIKIPAIQPGKKYSKTLGFWSELQFKPGTYKFRIVADAGKDILESNENNNKTTFTKTVKPDVNSYNANLPKKTTEKNKSKQNSPTKAGVVFGTNPGNKADLRIMPYYNNPAGLPEGFPTHSYCYKSPQGGTPKTIKFKVKNQGGATASNFRIAALFFGNSGAVLTKQVNNIGMGITQTFSFDIPPGCYTPPGANETCQFSLKIDDLNEVIEINESNNNKSSYCVGPAG